MEVEVTVYSYQKDGLLIAMGNVVIACGFTLLRQRMANTPNGVELWLRLKGEQGRLLELEDRLSSHPLVTHFEANHAPSTAAPVAAPQRPQAAPAARKAPTAPPPQKRASATTPATEIVEAILPSLARSYPKIFPQLLDLQQQIPSDRWGASLKYVGTRVGAWVYKRDYALGGQLDLLSAVRQIALPAVKTLLPAETRDYAIHVKNNPFCMPGTRCRNGEFFCGFLQGLLHEAGASSRVVVREVKCRSEGEHECVFEIVD
ncbi:hypothetical protein [Microbulbifer pacificus]|uniref:hypothetical protein n=1 Tax=Microbulbifer pacificus TaxID=407164 RepID=UPI000CF47DA7|nr:hypothetical protein [Microbulbifer pacificus]